MIQWFFKWTDNFGQNKIPKWVDKSGYTEYAN